MNLHLVTDDKFIEAFIHEWEQYEPDQNIYLVRDRADRSQLKHIKSPKAVCAAWGSKECEELVGDPARYHKIFIHYMGPELFRYVAGMPAGPKVLWIFWGGDYFYPPKMYANASYDDETRRLMAEREPRGPRGMVQRLRTLQHDVRWSLRKRAALARVDYMLHWNVLDYDAVTRETGWSAKYLPFDYDGGLLLEHEADPAAREQWRRFGQRRVVLLGNSGTPSNNHLSALNRLREIGLPKDVLVLCPLAYGDPRYADQVCEAGSRILGDQFEGLRTFMPLAEYRTLLERMNVGIMNHARTQAGANVIGLLCRGKRVFMNEHSTLYKLLSIGDAPVHPFSAVQDPEALFEPVSAKDVANTLQFLERRFGKSYRERSMAQLARL